jgi:hydroxymethylpyrimidine kinase/phosphomethylpyrimidine kinase
VPRERLARPPRLLTIAGSDSGGGAGIQADLKTFAAHGAYGMSVVTAVTAQNTRAVTAVHPIPPEVVAAQIDAVFEDIGVDAVKIGMLASAGIVEAVAERLRAWAGPPVVLDPVMVAKGGAPLLEDDAVAALRERLLPLASLVTPNLPEAERLWGHAIDDDSGRIACGRALAAGGCAVLLKGGHGVGQELVDLLWVGEDLRRFVHRRLDTRSTHGTGCTLSSAIAVRLGAGEPLAEAVAGGLEYLQGALRAAYPLGGGHGPVDHLFRAKVTA